MALARQPYKVNGQEIRFLRRAHDWPTMFVADKDGVSPETVSRWDNDASPIADANERLLRLNAGLAGEDRRDPPDALRVPATDFDVEEILTLGIDVKRPADQPTREFCRLALKIPRQPIEQR